MRFFSFSIPFDVRYFRWRTSNWYIGGYRWEFSVRRKIIFLAHASSLLEARSPRASCPASSASDAWTSQRNPALTFDVHEVTLGPSPASNFASDLCYVFAQGPSQMPAPTTNQDGVFNEIEVGASDGFPVCGGQWRVQGW